MFPQIFGKYVLEREIAAGGMAVVYLATLRGAGGFEKRLVVKQIRAELATDEGFVRRFVEEAKTTVELSHPNIVPVYELGVEQGVYYIAMEFADGLTLSELLDREGVLTPAEGAHLGVEICRGLDYAHRRAGVIHRDVTPRNVVIDEEGHVRVIDFGIAAPAFEELRGQKVFGSPGHMPQEQLRGLALTPATDVFAVAALLVEAWTGKPPFRRDTAEASERALSEPRPRLSAAVPELAALDDLVAHALSFEPEERPQSAEELARPLRAFLRDEDAADVARRLGRRVLAAWGHAADAEAEERREPATPVTPALSSEPGHVVTAARSGARRSDRPAESGVVAGRATPVTAVMTGARGDRVSTGGVTQTFAAREQLLEWTAPSPPRDVLDGPGSEAPSWGSRRWFLWSGAAVGLTAAVGLLVRREFAPAPVASPAPSGSQRGGSRAGSLDSAVVRGASPPSATSPAAAPRPASIASAAPRARGRVPERDRGPRPSPDETTLEAAATLSLTSDMPAVVRVGGQTVGTTPVKGLSRPAGRYQVSFVNAELDESVATTVEVAAGQVLGVHAEFTRATPTVRIR